MLHAANSAATCSGPTRTSTWCAWGSRCTACRPGPALDAPAPSLRPAMSLRSRVAMTKRVPAGDAVSYGLRYRLDRDATIATVPVGYADGYRGRCRTGRRC